MLYDGYGQQCCGGHIVDNDLQCCGNATQGQAYAVNTSNTCCGEEYVPKDRTLCCGDPVEGYKVCTITHTYTYIYIYILSSHWHSHKMNLAN